MPERPLHPVLCTLRFLAAEIQADGQRQPRRLAVVYLEDRPEKSVRRGRKLARRRPPPRRFPTRSSVPRPCRDVRTPKTRLHGASNKD